MIFFRFLIMVALSIGLAQADTTSDAKAGYNDGCRSARGHYTRSAYKYRHSTRYHGSWHKGKRICTRKHTVTKRTVRRRRSAQKHVDCNTETSWTAFRRGWTHGNRSARGSFYVDHSGCGAYRRGWVSGYRDDRCGTTQKPDSYAEGYYAGCASVFSIKIRDNYYYKNRSGYRHGWIQGYRDCRGNYR